MRPPRRARTALRTRDLEVEHESALLEGAKFESEATRAPVLDARIEALLTELSAQAQTRLEEQACAHEKRKSRH
jgi:hypothetical protein